VIGSCANAQDDHTQPTNHTHAYTYTTTTTDHAPGFERFLEALQSAQHLPPCVLLCSGKRPVAPALEILCVVSLVRISGSSSSSSTSNFRSQNFRQRTSRVQPCAGKHILEVNMFYKRTHSKSNNSSTCSDRGSSAAFEPTENMYIIYIGLSLQDLQ
jgi:hypothetical protein